MSRCGGMVFLKLFDHLTSSSDEAYWQFQSCFLSSVSTLICKKILSHFTQLNMYQKIALGCEDKTHLHYIEHLVYTVRTALHCAPLSLIPGALINPSYFWHIETKHVWARKVHHEVGNSTQWEGTLGHLFRQSNRCYVPKGDTEYEKCNNLWLKMFPAGHSLCL